MILVQSITAIKLHQPKAGNSQTRLSVVTCDKRVSSACIRCCCGGGASCITTLARQVPGKACPERKRETGGTAPPEMPAVAGGGSPTATRHLAHPSDRSSVAALCSSAAMSFLYVAGQHVACLMACCIQQSPGHVMSSCCVVLRFRLMPKVHACHELGPQYNNVSLAFIRWS